MENSPAKSTPSPYASSLPAGYSVLLTDLKSRIRSTRVRAALAVNAEIIGLYWDIGRMIVERQTREGWGKSVVERLSEDLRQEFPDQRGLSPQNLWFMRQFYLEWTQSAANAPPPVEEIGAGERPILQHPVREIECLANTAQPARGIQKPEDLLRVVREIPWGHNIDLVTKVKNLSVRLWYARRAIENGWSRAVLTAQIESGLHKRQGAALTNFDQTLPAPNSDLAHELFKDPYVLDFVTGKEHLEERELEGQLTSRITQFLLELGKGFAFVGRQYRLDVAGDEFFIDLLFYHIHLRCYVVVDLKTGKFQPEFAGKMNFYLEAVDRQIRRPPDSPSIGLILCKDRNRLVVEYALARARSPLGVATWQFTRNLPKSLEGELPSVEDMQRHIAADAQTVHGETEETP